MTVIHTKEGAELSRGELLASAKGLVPALRERAEECERSRVVAEQTIREYLDAGLYRVTQPARYGGLEMGYDVLCEMGMELSRGCGS